jgi:hypothetical protein
MMSRALLFVALALIGCHKRSTDGGLEQISDAFGAAGVETGSLRPADATPLHADKCVGGLVDGVDTMVCEYRSPEAAAAGKAAGEKWVGVAVTAAVITNGLVVLAVADRAHGDPNGKTIHKITQAFTKSH